MESSTHTFNSLFEQLGLPSSDAEIDTFIAQNRGAPSSVLLHQMPIWNDGQAQFLRQAIQEDADWAELVDELDTRLR